MLKKPGQTPLGNNAAEVATQGSNPTVADYSRSGNSWEQQVDLGRKGWRGNQYPLGIPTNMNFVGGRN